MIIDCGRFLAQYFFAQPHDHPLIWHIVSLEIAVGFLQFGIFCLFIILVRLFHLRWGQHAAGIVFGFGVAPAGSLVAFLLRSEFGTNSILFSQNCPSYRVHYWGGDLAGHIS